MKFKSDKQRRAVMAKLNSNVRSPDRPNIIHSGNFNKQRLRKRGIIINPNDNLFSYRGKNVKLSQDKDGDWNVKIDGEPQKDAWESRDDAQETAKALIDFDISKNLSFKQLKKKGIKLNPRGDADKDGTINKKDCKPLDPKKQGFLHDLQIKRLHRLEEKAEKRREKEQKKLQDLKDKLNQKSAVASIKTDIRNIKLKEKQSIIDEIGREKQALRDVKDANKKAKIELDKLTVTGKTKTFLKKEGVIVGTKSKQLLNATNAFLRSKKTKRAIKSIGKVLNSVGT